MCMLDVLCPRLLAFKLDILTAVLCGDRSGQRCTAVLQRGRANGDRPLATCTTQSWSWVQPARRASCSGKRATLQVNSKANAFQERSLQS